MFKKNNEPEVREAPLAPGYTSGIEVRTRNVSVIGPTLIFKGELSANEDLIIEGRIEGTISHQDKNLTVGKNGRVQADIHAQIVEIQGEVDGDIRGDQLVKLTSSAVVNGNIRCARICMEDGAIFSGTIHMEREKESIPKAAPLKVAEKKATSVGQGVG